MRRGEVEKGRMKMRKNGKNEKGRRKMSNVRVKKD